MSGYSKEHHAHLLAEKIATVRRQKARAERAGDNSLILYGAGRLAALNEALAILRGMNADGEPS